MQAFSKDDVDSWLEWVKTNIDGSDFSTKEVPLASDAEDNTRSSERVSVKRVGG